MYKSSVIIFLVLAILFAGVHIFALAASLYWYLWWFDIMMHAWGGVLLVLGVHVFSTFSWLPIRSNWPTILTVLFIATVSWEIFEWSIGLYDPETYVFDTTKDIVVGFSFGVLAQLYLRRNSIK